MGKNGTERDAKTGPSSPNTESPQCWPLQSTHKKSEITPSSLHSLFLIGDHSNGVDSKPRAITTRVCHMSGQYIIDQPTLRACRQGVSMDAPSKNFMVGKEGGRKA